MNKVTYIGGLPSGIVQCPQTLRSFPFARGQEFLLPDSVAVSLATQSPDEWTVSSAVQAIIEANRLAAEAAAKQSSNPQPEE